MQVVIFYLGHECPFSEPWWIERSCLSWSCHRYTSSLASRDSGCSFLPVSELVSFGVRDHGPLWVAGQGVGDSPLLLRAGLRAGAHPGSTVPRAWDRLAGWGTGREILES